MIVAPLMLTVIVHRFRLRLIGGNSCATTRGGNFYNNADAHQPKGKDSKYDYRHPGAIGRVSTPVSPLCNRRTLGSREHWSGLQ